jgi:hypothetical protein
MDYEDESEMYCRIPAAPLVNLHIKHQYNGRGRHNGGHG